MIVGTTDGFVNRSLVAEPNGEIWFQDKLMMTQCELDDWSLTCGRGQVVRQGLGVTVCYDTEFSRVYEPLADQGVLVVAVPSFTETPHGHHRVHTCAAARATEFQVVVAVAPLLGSLGGEPVPTTHGHPAIYAPSVPPFPADGVLAKGETIAIAEFDPATLLKARECGDVRNFHDQARLRT
jgi:predicted amidohydrolase